MIIKLKTDKNTQDSAPQASQEETREYIKHMLGELGMVAGASGLQDVQAFLKVTYAAIVDIENSAA